MANLLYRASTTATVPLSTTAKNAPLTNLEVDGNFKSINDELILKAPLASPTFTGDVAINSTTALKVPVGTDGERPTGVNGLLRYNSTSGSFEGYSAGSWGSIGGGAKGGAGNAAFWENDQTITADYTITASKNAGTFGPITVASGITVTIPDGSSWTIV